MAAKRVLTGMDVGVALLDNGLKYLTPTTKRFYDLLYCGFHR